MKAFNATVGVDKRVYYQSVYTTIDNSFDDLLFFYSHRYIQTMRGANDGLVSAYSADWGNTVVQIADGISHAEITEYKMKDIAGVHIPGLYVQIADALGRKGF
jgi:hypothetical protein